MAKKLYEIENFTQVFVATNGSNGNFYYKDSINWLDREGNIVNNLIAQKMDKEIWEPFVEKPKVEFKKFWKWLDGTDGFIHPTDYYFDDDGRDMTHAITFAFSKNDVCCKIENDFIVCKKNNETGKWDFVRHSSQEITKEELENG